MKPSFKTKVKSKTIGKKMPAYKNISTEILNKNLAFSLLHFKINFYYCYLLNLTNEVNWLRLYSTKPFQIKTNLKC